MKSASRRTSALNLASGTANITKHRVKFGIHALMLRNEYQIPTWHEARSLLTKRLANPTFDLVAEHRVSHLFGHRDAQPQLLRTGAICAKREDQEV